MNASAVTLYVQIGAAAPFRERCAQAFRVLDFTYTLGVVFYNRGDQCGH
jgi:hypothetical protein